MNISVTSKYLLFVVVVTLGAVACKKTEGDNQNLDPTKQTWYDFMSSKKGSWWRYGSRSGITWQREAREKDTIMLGKRYRYYERRDDTSGGFDPEYFGKNDKFYLTLMDLDGSKSNYIDYVYWKDSATTGATYNNTGELSSPFGKVQAEIESHVAEDNLTMSWGGRTFTKVVHAHSTMFGKLPPLIPRTNVGTLDVWFVKGLGIIKEEAHIDILGQYKQDHIDSLIDYHIEP